MIKFNIPFVSGNEKKYLNKLFESNMFCGDGFFTKQSSIFLQNYLSANKVLLTTSCTHAIEMAALLIDFKPGDEVIMPSYTFVSTANPFILRGANVVFVDINPETMNIDENLIENAITNRTKAIVPVHYAGISCEMDLIVQIAKKHNLNIIEDAAQALNSTYKGKALGTIGDIGCLSFHETKNLQCGEGGAIIINNDLYSERAEIIREKGTNRANFLRGQVDKYSWKDVGSSYLPSELNAAFLLAQLESIQKVFEKRKMLWDLYFINLNELNEIELPFIPKSVTQNHHMFYIKVKNIEERSLMIDFLKIKGINAVFHYVPLHSSDAGRKYSRFVGADVYTTKESERLLRLPLHFNLTEQDVIYICNVIKEFYSRKS